VKQAGLVGSPSSKSWQTPSLPILGQAVEGKLAEVLCNRAGRMDRMPGTRTPD
jgi:hypothetical protein